MYRVTRQFFDQDTELLGEATCYPEAMDLALGYAGGDCIIQILNGEEVVATSDGGRWTQPLRGKHPSYAGMKEEEIG